MKYLLRVTEIFIFCDATKGFRWLILFVLFLPKSVCYMNSHYRSWCILDSYTKIFKCFFWLFRSFILIIRALM
jgi:hypothetical protein